MIQPAEILSQSIVAGSPVRYEQPLSERMRTFLRLEYLYDQLLFHIERESQWASRAAVTSLLDIIAILGRGDLRSDIIKELERQIYIFDRYQDIPNVDEDRLSRVLRNLQTLRQELNVVGPQYLLSVRESEFLNAVKHRSTIPGGTCEFDLPDYSHWLRKPYELRLADIKEWTKNLRPLCASIAELLWLMRMSGETFDQVAINGVFQHALRRNITVGLIRVSMAPGSLYYPEISGSRHRFTVRFMEWANASQRAAQTNHNVEFNLTIC
jgi:cell division protein ZapD